jgi:hypothetical protein
MMSKRIRVVSVAFGLVAFMASGAALAQDKAGGNKADGDKGDGYGYEFDDDPLAAGGFGPSDATIRVRPRAARTTLIRPRIQFVDEMLKSVENL